MTKDTNYNKKFKYQLTNFMPRKELEPFIEPFTADRKWEGLDYVIKKQGNKDSCAIFTKGEYLVKENPKSYKRNKSCFSFLPTENEEE